MNKWLCLLCCCLPLFGYSEADDPCNTPGGGAMAGSLCVAKKMESADRELNRTYQEAIARIREEESWQRQYMSNYELEEPFRAAQRAWLVYRDAQCRFNGLSLTTSPWAGVQVENCKLDMTLERIEYFKLVLTG